MKKLIVKAIIASAFVFAIGLNISVNQILQNKDVSLALKSVEALADGEDTKYPKMSNGSTFCCKDEMTDGCNLAKCDF